MPARYTLTNTPLLIPALSLIVGIIVGEYAGDSPATRLGSFLIWILSATILIGIFLYRHFRPALRSQTVYLPVTIVLFLSTGTWLTEINRTYPIIPVAYEGERLTMIVQLEDVPRNNSGSRWARTPAKLLSFSEIRETADTLWQIPPKKEKLWVYIDTTLNGSYTVGDILLFDGRIWPGNDSISQGYDRYMLRTRGITGRAYTWRIRNLGSDMTALNRICLWRDRQSTKLLRPDQDDPAPGIMQALALGDQSAIDRTVRSHYSRTGIAHILSVSGLHVGIVCLLLNLLLGWMKLLPHGRTVLSITIILLLSGYALMTGLSPSVVRATLMFSLFQIGWMISRQTHSLNTLCAAALVILIADPYYLFHIGFQLSFAAMVGITTLYQPLVTRLKPRNSFVRALWSLTAVTLSAQFTVFPLVVYHFGLFSVASVLLNPLVWITVPVIICGTLFYLLCGWEWVYEITAGVTRFQNHVIETMSSWKWVAADGIVWPFWYFLVIYGVITGFIVWINYRSLPASSRLRRP